MSEQYFTSLPTSINEEREFVCDFNKRAYKFITDNGVFSKDRVDYGSLALIRSILEYYGDKQPETILELGSGYGPISLILGNEFEKSSIVGIEINERALKLAQQNQKNNKIDNVQWILEDVTNAEMSEKYDLVVTNPPIRAGKQIIQKFVDQAEKYLNLEGNLILVIQKKQGAPSMKNYMFEKFGNVERIGLDKGYWILLSKKNN